MDGLQSGIGIPASAANLSATSFDGKLEAATRAVDGGSAEDAAKRLEALFATLLVKELRRALPEGLFGKGPGSETFEGWFDEHMGDALASNGALDLAGQIKTSLSNKAANEQAELPHDSGDESGIKAERNSG